MTLAQQFLKNAITVVCDSDFCTKFPHIRKNIYVDDLARMNNQCEVL